MANLLDGVLGAIRSIQNIEALGPFGPALAALSLATSPDMVDKIAAMLPAAKRDDPAVQAALAALKEDLGKVKGANPYDVLVGLEEGEKNPVADEVRSALIKAVTDILGSGGVNLSESLGVLARVPVNGVLKAIEGVGGKLDEDLKAQIVNSLSPMISLGLSWVILSTLAELIQPVKNMGFGQISHFLYDTVGFKALSESYIAPVREAMIEDPIRHQVLAVARPFSPSLGSVAWLARKRLITREEFDRGQAFWGVKASWSDLEWQGLWSQPRLLELVRMQEGADLPPDYLQKKLTLAGFADEDIPYLLRSLRARYITIVAGNIHTTKRAQYMAGKITRDQYTAFLSGEGLTPAEYGPFIAAADDERAFDAARDAKADQAAATRAEVAALRTLYRNRYKRGEILRDQYIGLLTGSGVTATQAGALADAVDGEVQQGIDQDLQRAFEARYLKGQLTDDEIRGDLKAVHLTDAAIGARMKYLAEQKALHVDATGDVKVLSQAQVLAAYKAGQLQRGDALKRITDMGYSVADAGLLLLEQDRVLLEDVRAEVIRAAEQRALSGRASRADLIKVYLDNGKTQAWAEARADYLAERILGKETTA